MKHLSIVLACAALSACVATNPRQGPPEWGYAPGQAAPANISEVEAETLRNQYLEFKLSREQMRAAYQAAPDAATRAKYAADIESLTRAMEPLAYRLRSAGRPLP